MSLEILKIYGPIGINGFNLFIMISLITFTYLIKKDKNIRSLFSKEDVIDLIAKTGLVAILGGRLLHVINSYKDYSNIIEILSIWNGGLAVIGALISGVLYLILSLYKKKINIIYVLDIVSAYLPLVHSIARIGCFFAGCCYGIKTDIFCSMNSLHPTQIYSSLVFLIIFFNMQILYLKYKLNKFYPGLLFSLYLLLSSLERFSIDFLRGDREYYINLSFLSKAQSQSGLMFIISLIMFLIFYRQKRSYEHI